VPSARTIVTSLRSLSAIRSKGRPSSVARGCRRVGQLGEEVMRGVVGEFVDGVEAQGIDVEVPEPPQHLIDEERSDAVGPGGIEIDCGPPRRVVGVGEIGTETREVVAARPEVVVDQVQADADPARVGGVDEPLQRRRASIAVMDRVEATPS
jgi:hypothetical protein